MSMQPAVASPSTPHPPRPAGLHDPRFRACPCRMVRDPPWSVMAACAANQKIGRGVRPPFSPVHIVPEHIAWVGMVAGVQSELQQGPRMLAIPSAQGHRLDKGTSESCSAYRRPITQGLHRSSLEARSSCLERMHVLITNVLINGHWLWVQIR